MKNIQGIGVVLLALAHGQIAEAKVSAKEISELIRSADVIVLAKVVKVGDSKDVPLGNGSNSAVATAKVLESWKGEVGDTVEFSLQKAWSCDVSGAVADEKAVLFLDKKYRGDERVTVMPGVYFLAFWGRGRMPIVDQGGKLFARVQGEVLLAKQGLESRRSPEFPGENLVELDRLKAYVRGLAAPSAAHKGVAPDGRPRTATRGLTPTR